MKTDKENGITPFLERINNDPILQDKISTLKNEKGMIEVNDIEDLARSLGYELRPKAFVKK